MKNKIVASLLGIFLGSFGIHKFYLGRTTWGIVYLLLFWTGIPGIIGFIEGIIYLVMSEDAFDKKYNLGGGLTKKCPMCAEDVKMDAVKCKHCGSDLKVTDV